MRVSGTCYPPSQTCPRCCDYIHPVRADQRARRFAGTGSVLFSPLGSPLSSCSFSALGRFRQLNSPRRSYESHSPPPDKEISATAKELVETMDEVAGVSEEKWKQRQAVREDDVIGIGTFSFSVVRSKRGSLFSKSRLCQLPNGGPVDGERAFRDWNIRAWRLFR